MLNESERYRVTANGLSVWVGSYNSEAVCLVGNPDCFLLDGMYLFYKKDMTIEDAFIYSTHDQNPI